MPWVKHPGAVEAPGEASPGAVAPAGSRGKRVVLPSSRHVSVVFVNIRFEDIFPPCVLFLFSSSSIKLSFTLLECLGGKNNALALSQRTQTPAAEAPVCSSTHLPVSWI